MTLDDVAAQDCAAVEEAMERHFRALGWIHLVIGVAACLTCLVLWVAAAFEPPSRGTMTSPNFGFGFAILFGVVFLLAPGGVVALNGWGLLSRRPWARVLTIVLCAIGLLVLQGLASYIPEGVEAARDHKYGALELAAGTMAALLVTAIPVLGLWAMLRPGSTAAWTAYVSRESGPAG